MAIHGIGYFVIKADREILFSFTHKENIERMKKLGRNESSIKGDEHV